MLTDAWAAVTHGACGCVQGGSGGFLSCVSPFLPYAIEVTTRSLLLQVRDQRVELHGNEELGTEVVMRTKQQGGR